MLYSATTMTNDCYWIFLSAFAVVAAVVFMRPEAETTESISSLLIFNIIKFFSLYILRETLVPYLSAKIILPCILSWLA